MYIAWLALFPGSPPPRGYAAIHLCLVKCLLEASELWITLFETININFAWHHKHFTTYMQAYQIISFQQITSTTLA